MSIKFFFIDTEGNGLIFEKNIECHKIAISFIVSRKKLEGFCELLIQLDTASTTQFSAREWGDSHSTSDTELNWTHYIFNILFFLSSIYSS